MTVRLLHTADWQLGRAFGGFPETVRGALHEARFEAVATVARLAREHEVAAVLVAGDVFDADGVARRTIDRAFQRMEAFPGPWVLMPGNHDAAVPGGLWDRLAHAGLPASVIAAVSPEPIPLAGGAAVVLPAPLRARRVSDDLTEWWDGALTPAGALRVGLAHGSLTGRLPAAADADNPIAPDRAARARLDYLALGDWHGCREEDPRTWYAGTPEPDRFPMNDPGWALLVELEAPGTAPRVTKLRTAGFSWLTRELSLAAPEPDQLQGLFDAVLADLGQRSCTLLRLTLSGVVSLAARAALDDALDKLGNTLCHLECDDDALVAQPDALDRALLAGEPLLTEAAGRLAARAEGAADPEDRAVAELALRLLFAHGAASP